VSEADHPGAAVRPPLLHLAALIAGLVLDRVVALPLPATGPVTLVAGGLAAVAGIGLMAWAITCFRRAGTNVPTVLPATALVTAGPYRFSRNPIYVGMIVTYLGLALAFASPWALLLSAPVLLVMHVGVVRREERYLEAKFGEAYRTYRRRVRRWL